MKKSRNCSLTLFQIMLIVFAFVGGLACYLRYADDNNKHDIKVQKPVQKMDVSGVDSSLRSAFSSLDAQGGKTFTTKSAVSGETVNTNEGEEAVSMVTVANKGQRERELREQIKKAKQ